MRSNEDKMLLKIFEQQNAQSQKLEKLTDFVVNNNVANVDVR